MKRILLFILSSGFIVAALAGFMAWQFAHNPLTLPTAKSTFEFTVERGSNLKSLGKKLAKEGLLAEPVGADSFWLLGRFTNQAAGIQAGTYRLDKPISPLALLKKLNDGDVVSVAITFVEGVTFRQMRAQLVANPLLKQSITLLSDRAVLGAIGATESHPEGLFFPDTYRFSQGASDIDILKMSFQAMQKKLALAWSQREEGLPYATPYEALIMASIIEKETGRADERAMIGGVFINRLRIPMRLQTDPTVIYGMGENFDGNIRRRDLTNDTVYNTYTRDGLPPTPIAMPGLGALMAAVQPEKSDNLYFVAMKDGQGSHAFSRTLAEHNRAVAKYQLGR